MAYRHIDDNINRWRAGAAICLALSVLFFMSSCSGAQKRKEQADSHLNIGMAYVEGGNYTAALKELLEAEKNAPDNPKIHYYLSVAYFGKGYNDKAIEECEKAVSIKGDYSSAYNFLGTLYYSQGQYDKAIFAFSRALDDVLYETPEMALYNMGKAYYRKGDLRKAMAKYQEAATRDARRQLLPLIEQDMGKVEYARGDMVNAIAHFQKATELAPSLVESHYWLGECYLKQKRNGDARRAYETVVKIAPSSDFGLKAKKILQFMDI